MKKRIIFAVFLAAILTQPLVVADDMVEGYVKSPYGAVYKNSFGECWRSSFKETTEKLEECGYQKPTPTMVIKQEVVAAPTAVTVTTKMEEKINIRAALLFGFDSDVLSDDAKSVLDERIAKYKDRGELTSNVQVIGHTCSIGSQEYNQNLSERRAQAVARYLEQHTNIQDKQIDAIGRGESEPEASNDTREGRALNRRVVIILDGKLKQ